MTTASAIRSRRSLRQWAWALVVFSLVLLSLFSSPYSEAHHVLGRPAYSLNEDSNTPPSMAVETQIGNYFVTYMVFPAFVKANEPGRINLYATRIDGGAAFDGEVTFTVRDQQWFGEADAEVLGKQRIDDAVYRQGFVFQEDGRYIVRAHFEDGGEPYDIDFPLQVGQASPIGPVGIASGLLLVILLGTNLVQRKRLARSKIRSAQLDP